LIYLAKHEQKAREYFNQKPESWSWRHAWETLLAKEALDEACSRDRENGKDPATTPTRRRRPNPPRVSAATIQDNERRLAEDRARREAEARRAAAENAFAGQGGPANLAGAVIDVDPSAADAPAPDSPPPQDDVPAIDPAAGSDPPTPDPADIPIVESLHLWRKGRRESNEGILAGLAIFQAEIQKEVRMTKDSEPPIHSTPLPQNAFDKNPRHQWQPRGTIKDPAANFPEMSDIWERNPHPNDNPSRPAEDIKSSESENGKAPNDRH
jgi:hypothetical protein